MASKRESLINEISKLHEQQIHAYQEADLNGWTKEQARLAFDTGFARIGSLVRDLAALDDKTD